MTTGAGNDIERATDMARKMVCEWGMSELGPLTFGKAEREIFLGRDFGSTQDYSEATANQIDDEVTRIVTSAYDRAQKLITDNKKSMHRLARTLLEKEVLDGDEVLQIIAEETGTDISKLRKTGPPKPPILPAARPRSRTGASGPSFRSRPRPNPPPGRGPDDDRRGLPPGVRRRDGDDPPAPRAGPGGSAGLEAAREVDESRAWRPTSRSSRAGAPRSGSRVQVGSDKAPPMTTAAEFLRHASTRTSREPCRHRALDRRRDAGGLHRRGRDGEVFFRHERRRCCAGSC